MKRLSHILVLLFPFGLAFLAKAQEQTDAIGYISSNPFGWGTCSDLSGTSYNLDGGHRNPNPSTIVLYSSGGDDREFIRKAIESHDIIILDGSKGDFIVSETIKIYNLNNKTIVGRNNARICTQWYITPELKEVLERANLGQYSSASGTGGTLSNGVNVSEARELHTRQTIIDYMGDDMEAYRYSGVFQMNSTNENIIFRNLSLVGPGSVDVGGYDLISNYGGTHVWVDHCEFIDGMDGNLDSGKRDGSEQFVTYSWNIFRYTERSFSHPYSNGVGWNKGYLQYVTYAYNIWDTGCTGRMPLADWVYLHMLNNYYNVSGNYQTIAVNANSHALIEGNYAEATVKYPFTPGNYDDLFYNTRNNYGFGSYNNASNTQQSLDVPYSYKLIPTQDVPAMLRGIHGSGATLDDVIDQYIMTAPDHYYSRRMTQSQGKAWSADKSWDYVSGLVSKSLLKCATQYPNDEWSLNAYEWCRQYADAALNTDGSFKNFKKGNIDNIASGKIFFELYKRELSLNTQQGKNNAAKYKAAADYLYKYLRYEYSRITFEDGLGGFFHKDVYPNQMWLDGLYMGAAFYAEYLYHFAPEDSDGWADVARQFITIHSHTYHPSKRLNFHGWSADPSDANSFWANKKEPFLGCSQEFWGRGMGWYFAALVDVLELMPSSHPDYVSLCNILAQVAEGLSLYQDSESGVWYQLLQYDNSYVGQCGIANYLEASASSMFTYSYLKALRLGLISDSYRTVAEKAYQGVLKTFITENSNKTININQSCRSAGLGPSKSPQRDGSADYYLCGSDVTIVSNEGKAIGPFIMASLEWELAYGNIFDEGNTPDVGEDPVIPEEPIHPSDMTCKHFSADYVLLTNEERLSEISVENWTRGGATTSSKLGTIDPNTGENVEAYRGGGIIVKKGNSAKTFETLVSGVKEVTVYACTSGSSSRTLIISAKDSEGNILSAKGTSSDYVSVAVSLSLDASKPYLISYTGVLADDEDSGADMILHGIRFKVANIESNLSAISIHNIGRSNLYTLQGVLLRRQILWDEEKTKLPSGIYLMNGKKVIIP